MVIAISIIVFIICCCMESFEDSSRRAQRNAQRRHEELMEAIRKDRENARALSVKKKKVTRRRIAKDSAGNTLAEEITEEEL